MVLDLPPGSTRAETRATEYNVRHDRFVGQRDGQGFGAGPLVVRQSPSVQSGTWEILRVDRLLAKVVLCRFLGVPASVRQAFLTFPLPFPYSRRDFSPFFLASGTLTRAAVLPRYEYFRRLCFVRYDAL